MHKISGLIVAGCLALAGCQTPYQEGGFSGGVKAVALTNDVYRISARGNGFTSRTTIQDYTLLKAAETTLQQGGTHFVILQNDDATRTSLYSTPSTMQTNVYGNTAYSTFNPGYTDVVVKPGEDVIIRVIKVRKGQAVPPGAFPAQELVNNISPRVRRGWGKT